MNPKAFVTLAAITLVAVVGATYAVLGQPGTTTLQLVDEPAFPTLRENPDAVAKIVVTTPDGKITLVRETGDRWAALERYGYPVDRQRVRELVVALADMRLIERKTAQAELYHRLQVEDPDAENAKSHLVRLESESGTVLAEAIIGKQRYRLTGTEPSGTYLRRPGEAASWLGSGAVQIGEEVTAWLDDQIVDLDGQAIERISLQPATGPGYVVERDEPGGELGLADLADSETVKEDADFARLTGAFSGVRLEDVRPRDQLKWPEESSLAQVRTFDGLELTVRLAQIDDAYWAIFDARAIEPAAPAADQAATGAGPATAAQPASDQTPPAASAEAAEDARTTQSAETVESAQAAETGPAGQSKEAGSEEAQNAEAQNTEAESGGAGGAGAEGVEEVSLEEPEEPVDPAELSKRLGKWAYQIPEHLYNRLTTGRSEFVTGPDSTS